VNLNAVWIVPFPSMPVAFFVIRLRRGRMTKKVEIFWNHYPGLAALTLYSFSGVIHGRSKSILSCSATPPVNNAGAMWLSRIFLMAYFGFGSGTNSLPGSRHEHSPNFRPEPQPEHGYASSGDDDNVPFYTVCAPRSFHTGTLA